jgi:DNA-binding MarR family transcriptional regulator
MAAHPSPPVVGDTDAQLAAAVERLGTTARLLLRRAAAAHGLAVIQAELVLRLARIDGPGSGLRELAAEFDVTAPTVSDSLAALRRKGLVEAVTPSRDRRRVHNLLTRAGRAVAVDLAGWDAPLQRRLAEIADRGDVLQSLLGVIAGLLEDGVITVARTCLTCRFLRTEEPRAGLRAVTSRLHCGLLDISLPPELLRADCPDHQRASGDRSR